jgi:CBS domain-containing protein
MSAPVVSVSVETSLHALAKVLSEHRISGVPVVDGDRVVGVVSESDLIEKERGPDDEAGHFPHRRQRRPRAAFANTVAEAMTSPPLVVESWMSAYEAAWLMSIDDVNRLPVVDDGKLVGVISRADLVRYFARPDADIERDVRDELELLSVVDLEISVEEGCVEIVGEVDRESDLRCLRHAISRIPGVVSVRTTTTLRDARGRLAPVAR